MGDKLTDMLKKVRQIEIRTNRHVSDALAGAYHSLFKGRGMDFEEAREYEPGDEIRSIDWNVTARTGKAHVKKYREERELTMMIAVDLSASGQFGSGELSKRELAAELASTLAFSAARNGDKVGLALFTEGVEHIIPPRKGRRHILRLIRDILVWKPQKAGTDIAAALDEINRILKRRAIVVLISDFLQGPDGRLPTPTKRFPTQSSRRSTSQTAATTSCAFRSPTRGSSPCRAAWAPSPSKTARRAKSSRSTPTIPPCAPSTKR